MDRTNVLDTVEEPPSDGIGNPDSSMEVGQHVNMQAMKISDEITEADDVAKKEKEEEDQKTEARKKLKAAATAADAFFLAGLGLSAATLISCAISLYSLYTNALISGFQKVGGAVGAVGNLETLSAGVMVIDFSLAFCTVAAAVLFLCFNYRANNLQTAYVAKEYDNYHPLYSFDDRQNQDIDEPSVQYQERQ
jgi:thiol:disulfide interchange protein